MDELKAFTKDDARELARIDFHKGKGARVRPVRLFEDSG
jgi:hypothetical protein